MVPPPRDSDDAPARSGNSNRSGSPPARRDGSHRKRRGHRVGQHGGQRTSSIGLTCIGGGDFEFVHPRQVKDVDLDYHEGLEIREAGDPEGARDALRFALGACHDNLWIHVALGKIALDDFRDPALARGHFGYAVEVAERALPRGFRGRLPPERPSNRPFFEAIAGLAQCYDALGRSSDAIKVRALGRQLSGKAGQDHP